jgi:ribosomal protein L40E
MSRKSDLEQHIRESYRLICEFEEVLRLSDNPKEQSRARRAIKEQGELVKGYLSEYVPLCENLGVDMAQDIFEIAIVVRFPVSSPSSKSGDVVFCHGCGHANPKRAQFCRFCGTEIRIRSGEQAIEAVVSGTRAEDVARVVSHVIRQSAQIAGKGIQHLEAHALLIGVGDYSHPRFASLPATARDAQALAAILTDPSRCGYQLGNVQAITGDHAFANNIRATLQNLTQTTNSQSTVFIYFSGHGGRALENGNWRTFLCPREADPDDLAHTAIPGEEFSALLAAIPAQKMLVILDACHASGSAELKAADGTTVWKAGLPDDYYEALSQGSGRVVIASSKEDQYSYVRKQGDLSLFTWHLREALGGKAAVRGDGLIHVLDVFHYVNEAVQADEPKQVPILKVKDLDLNFPIAVDRGGKGAGAGPAVGATPVVDIREQIVRDPIGGARALSEYLTTRPEWSAKRNEVDLKRADLERIQHELDLFGPDPGGQAAKNRAVFFLLKVCLELEQPGQ